MKIKLSWIVFIPFTLVIGALGFIQAFVLTGDETFMGLSRISASYTSVVLAAVLLIICKVFSVLDKKTSKIYVGGKNIAAGIFSSVIAISLAINGAKQLVDSLAGEWAVYPVVDMILSIISAVAFVVIAISHITGKNFSDGFALLILMPSVWCCARIINTFIGYTTLSVTSTDMTDLVLYVAAALYLYWQATVLVNIAGKNSVKSCYVFGMPTAALAIGYGSKLLIDAVLNETKDLYQYLYIAVFLALGLYIISTLLEYTFRVHSLEEDAYLLDEKADADGEAPEEYDDDILSSAIADTDDGIVRQSVQIHEDAEPLEAEAESAAEVDYEQNTEAYDIIEEPEEEHDFDSSTGGETTDPDRMREINRLIKEIENDV